MHKLGSSTIGCEDFRIPRKYHNWGIGIGSSPIDFESCEQPRMAAKAKQDFKLVLQDFVGYSNGGFHKWGYPKMDGL